MEALGKKSTEDIIAHLEGLQQIKGSGATGCGVWA
jgi:hypothetical protein